ncbi:Predicted arabinose efflux permease, MFS family [Paenimyroides ummariense]|uniref:Predicted arabinose efflux permease, MFS family n=2 Tax=Paenimyroides ummariense TaxID=913024 RepID=A0A1I4Z3Q8_9FLAO|nr:Predicted arabinose efflux permease, MFS family [Paenimyroides ummariense]
MAPDKNLATLPLAMITVGTAGMMIPASLIIRKLGQRNAFMIGTLIGVLSGLVSWYAIIQNSFWLFSVGNMLIGAYQGFSQYYRFAAADVVPDNAKSKAISFVIAGGVVAAFAGPNLARFTQHLGAVPYAYSYFSIILLSVVALGVVSFLKLQRTSAVQTKEAVKKGRPLKEIIKNKDTILAILASSTAFAVMGMSMTVTPIAMHSVGHSSDSSATVIQWHVLGMFLPSFFTGMLIQKFGVYRIIISGLAILSLYIVIALMGTGFAHFVSALFIVGLGWNFLFIGGSSLLTKVYRPEEKEKTQAFHDFTVFAVISIASFFAGSLFNYWGWNGVNIALIPMLIITLIVVTRIVMSQKNSVSNQ